MLRGIEDLGLAVPGTQVIGFDGIPLRLPLPALSTIRQTLTAWGGWPRKHCAHDRGERWETITSGGVPRAARPAPPQRDVSVPAITHFTW
jgi:hypothetical protein